MARAVLGALAAALAAVACGGDRPAAEWGAALFEDPSLSPSSLNRVACATCHQATPTPDPSRIDPGYNLWGVAARTAWFGDGGGNLVRLYDAVDTCFVYFMRGGNRGLDPGSDESKALYEYLLSITPEGSPTDPLPMTIVERIQPVPRGDATRGEQVYDAACFRCHGALHTGSGGLLRPPFVLPEEVIEVAREHFGDESLAELIATEKVRHGRFFSVGGVMPFFSLEALSDDQLGDVLEYLDLPNE
jgi:thiosulfate dehydrogenase